MTPLIIDNFAAGGGASTGIERASSDFGFGLHEAEANFAEAAK